MFWGLIMEPGKKYSQTVEKSFHVSHAALDLDSAQSAPVQVLLGFENRNYLLCTLNKEKWIQVPLDLNFQIGDKVSFATNGPGHVHLTGYLIPEDDYDMSINDSDVEEEEEDEEVPELSPVNNKKRKAESSKEKQNKKVKSETAKLLEEINEDESDESDDSDVNLTDLINDEALEEEEEDDEEVEDEDEEDDVEEEEENEEEDEVEEEEEVEDKPAKKQKKQPQQNGIVKPEKTKSDKAAKSNKNQGERSPKQKEDKPKKKVTKTLSGGVIIEDLKVGEGVAAANGRQVQVYYEGRLQSNNKLFDAAKKGNGFKFRLGKQEVIKGWDIGIAGMKVGGKRRIICPPHMAYGNQGSPPVIPPQATLIFEVELKNVK